MDEVLIDTFNILFAQHYGWFITIFMTMLISIIGLILKFAKKPIKHFTAKIKNENLRKLANKCIILLSFGLAIGVWFLLNHFFPAYFAINWVQIILSGALPVVVYAILDGVLPAESVKKIVNTVVDAAVDGMITKEEVKSISSQMNGALGSESQETQAEDTDKSAESELNRLLKG